MPSIGSDCHIKISHPDIDSGQPYGFLLQNNDSDNGPAVTIQREITAEGQVSVRIFFSVLLSDTLVNPDGSRHAVSRNDMYSALMSYLSKIEGLTLETPSGTLTSVGATGHSATEAHFDKLSIVTCQLNNSSQYFGFINATIYNNSCWDSTQSWDSSYWR